MYHGHKCSMSSFSPGMYRACGLVSAVLTKFMSPTLELFVGFDWLVFSFAAFTFWHATLCRRDQ